MAAGNWPRQRVLSLLLSCDVFFLRLIFSMRNYLYRIEEKTWCDSIERMSSKMALTDWKGHTPSEQPFLACSRTEF